MKHIDLFSGIGGFALAAKWAGFETIQFVEKDSFCQKVLKKNFPSIPIHDDIRTFHYKEKVELITGGFPCQPFSVAGKKRGKDDDRYLWPDFFRLIKECKPSWVVGENVTGIIEMALDDILDELEKEGYQTQTYIIPASAIGAPHRRNRIWIVANTNGERCFTWEHYCEKLNLQINFEQYVERIQKEWKELLPQSWQTFNFQKWMSTFTNTHGEQCNKKSKDMRTVSQRSKREEFVGKIGSSCSESERQESEPPIPGVDDGLPNGVDRNRALGNSIVPQVVYPILKMIYDLELYCQ